MSVKVTPMVQQYLNIKAEYQDSILFFRLGDFYEMFFDDAKIAAKELEIVLTSRESGNNKVPMCGVPYHSATNYIAKLIEKGYKVAICEQVEDPKAVKGIVKREVVQVITPGTVLETSMLDESKNNYLAAVFELDKIIGLAYIDVSTGCFWITEFDQDDSQLQFTSELQRLNPAECLIPSWSAFAGEWNNKVTNLQTTFTYINEAGFNLEDATKIIMEHYNIASLEGFGLQQHKSGICAAAMIIKFLAVTQKTMLKHLNTPRFYYTNEFLELDFATRRNLELTATLRESKKEGSLLSVLDCCATAMGKRTLKTWIEQPLTNVDDINKRLDAVEEVKNDLGLMNNLQEVLDNIYDLERLAGRIGSGIINPRDLLALKTSLTSLHNVKNLLSNCTSYLLQSIAKIDTLEDLYSLIDSSISDEAPLTIKEGFIFKEGYNSEIDKLRQLSKQGSTWLIDFENREKERLGIRTLKVGYNKVFGYYIEVTNPNLHLVPPEYHRKQTLVNAERFISDELKHYEDSILGSREKLFNPEYELFCELKEKLNQFILRIQATASQIACLDVIYSLARIAYTHNYIRPLVDNSAGIDIKNGRHPVVEQYLIESRFVPNDLHIDGKNINFAIITGPNMGGKSTYMRQAALLILMAQMGSFVPADYAHIGVADKIFTRVGASDDLSAGQSTFMLEMLEVANILNNATSKSFIILDEIGRGTSTYDGLSIAKAVSEYILSSIKARTLFATHYHELTSLADSYSSVINLSVSVKDTGDTVIFLKKVLPGKADKSYGVHVAQLAGLPQPVIIRANEILKNHEQESQVDKQKVDIVFQPDLFTEIPSFIKELKAIDLDNLTPIEALNYLYRWKKEII